MTSRERALTVLNGGTPDRVCIDFGATMATGINAQVYHRAKKLLGIHTFTTVVDVLSYLAEVEPDMCSAMGGDFVMLRRFAPSLGIPVLSFKPGALPDGTPARIPAAFHPIATPDGDLLIMASPRAMDYIHPYDPAMGDDPYAGRVVSKCPKGYAAFARVFHPMAYVETLDAFEKYEYPEFSQEEVAFYRREALRLRETTDKSIAGVFLGNVFEMGQLYFGYENFFAIMGGDEELALAYMEKRTQAFLRDLEKYLGAVGDLIDVIQFNDDLGTQDTTLISPAMYRRMIKPYHMRMFQYVRRNYPKVKVFFHTCGAVAELIPDIIECGAQILNPVQITAQGMSPKKLVRDFGGHIVFWGGGVDTQNVLNRATPEGVRSQVRELLDIYGKKGYVFSQIHNIDSSVPAENMIAAFQTAQEGGIRS